MPRSTLIARSEEQAELLHKICASEVFNANELPEVSEEEREGTSAPAPPRGDQAELGESS